MKTAFLLGAVGLALIATNCATTEPVSDGPHFAKPIASDDDYGSGDLDDVESDADSGMGGAAGGAASAPGADPAGGGFPDGGASGAGPGSGGAAGADPGSGGGPSADPATGGASGTDGGSSTPSCGGLNQVCCTGSAKCSSATTSCNAAGKCVPCGGAGEACCDAPDPCAGTKAKCCHDCGGAASGFHCICGDSYGAKAAGTCEACCVVCKNGFKASISAAVNLSAGETCDTAAEAVAKCASRGGVDKALTGWKDSCS